MINIAVTIDVENPQTPLFEKRFSDNRIWSDGYGIEKIIEILDKYGVKGSFFTNVYEYTIWGKGEMERIVKYIHDKGHDVELHTHPIWIDDKRRENIFQFPLREQAAIIQWGVDFIAKCTGRKPVCHRAGAYGFNRNTLRACEKAGIFIDSSNFFGHPNCRDVITKNVPIKIGNVLELPVTNYLRGEKIVKTDLDWILEEEFKVYVKTLQNEGDSNFINFFFHSYSLTNEDNGFSTYKFEPKKLAKLEGILAWLKTLSNCEIIPMGELLKVYKNCAKSSICEIPRDEDVSRSITVQTKPKIDFNKINLEKSQWYSFEQLREFQNYHLRRLVVHSCKHVPFYRNYMKENKIRLEDIKTVEDIKLLPIIDKDVIKKDPNLFQADNAEVYEPQWSHTSGSTGKPLRFMLDKNNLILESAFMNRAWSWAGLDKKTKLCVLRAFKIPGLCVEGQLYGQNTTLLSGYDISEKTMPVFVEQLRHQGRILLYGFPSNLYEFSRLFRDMEFKPLPIKGISTASETLYPFQRNLIQETLGAQICDMYGQGEHSSFINQCSEGIYHDNMEYGITEYLPLKETSLGTHEIIATGLHNFSMPFLRYRLNDSVFLYDEVCRCGRVYTAIKSVNGKKGDMIVKADGSYFSGISVTNAFGDYNDIKEYQVLQKDVNNFEITMVVSKDAERLKNIIREKIVEMIGAKVHCRFNIVDRIQRTEAGKHRIVKSLVKAGSVVSFSSKADSGLEENVKERDSSINKLKSYTPLMDKFDESMSVQTLLFINDNYWVNAIQEIKNLKEQFILTSAREFMFTRLKQQDYKLLDPKGIGKHYWHEKYGWGYFYPEKYFHVDIFEELFASLIDMPEIKYFKQYDLYNNGDYNMAYNTGVNILYLIDLLIHLISSINPRIVISLDGNSQSLESYLLQDLSTIHGFKYCRITSVNMLKDIFKVYRRSR